MWDDLKNTLVKGGLKVLGNSIPGGGFVADLVSDALGLDDSKPETIAKAIKENPEALLKLKELETKHKEKLKEIALQVFQAEVADKASARNREAGYIQATGHVDYFMSALGIIIVCGFFGTLALMAFSPNQEALNNSQPFNILLGFMGAAFMAVVGYYFGSSQGSATKTKLGAK